MFVAIKILLNVNQVRWFIKILNKKLRWVSALLKFNL